MPKYKQKEKLGANEEVESVPASERLTKLLERKTEAPLIEEVLTAATQAIKQAVKAKQKRRHKCRVCGKEKCIHYQRVDMDTQEEFDIRIDPETGEVLTDLGGGD